MPETKETIEQARERMISLIGLKIIDAGTIDGMDAVKLSNGAFLIIG